MTRLTQDAVARTERIKKMELEARQKEESFLSSHVHKDTRGGDAKTPTEGNGEADVSKIVQRLLQVCSYTCIYKCVYSRVYVCVHDD